MADKTIGALTANPAVLTTHKFPIEPVGGPPAEYNTIAQLLTLLDTIYAPITGGAYVLKAGDTMTGPLLASPDNTVDLGASGATRFRTAYFGTSLVTALLASPAATALSFASAGTTRANFSTAGHLLFNTTNTNDIGGASGNNPRGVYASTVMWAPTHQIGGSAAVPNAQFTAGSSTTLLVQDQSQVSFGRLQLGGTTSAFPSIKRSATIIQGRLADDSAYCPIEGDTVRTAIAYTVATLPAAGTAGRRAYVTNALAPAFGAAVAGGGAVVTPVFDDGTNWIVG